MATLDGKVAIVTGGGTGIGRATAILFASEGARVIVFGRRPEHLADVVDASAKAGGQATSVSGDIASEADVERLVAAAAREHGGVDVLVNSAAVRLRSALVEIAAADFAEVLRINLVGAFVVTKIVAGAMRARGGGSIIHIGSALGTVAAPDFSPYVASKGGLHQFARAAAISSSTGSPSAARDTWTTSPRPASTSPPTPRAMSPAPSSPSTAAGRRRRQVAEVFEVVAAVVERDG